MFAKNEHKTVEGKDKIVKIKSKLNDKGTTFT